MTQPDAPWQPFLEAGGIVIPWRMATVDGQETYHSQGVEPRAILFHSPNGHMGAVDPRQVEEEQRRQWLLLAKHLLELCDLPWSEISPTAPPLVGVGYHGFYDEVPAARDVSE